MFYISKAVISSGLQNESQTIIDFRKIAIIVGPNNSGKSTILKDIEEWFGGEYPRMKLVRNLELGFSDNSNDYTEFEKDILEFEDGEPIKNGKEESIPLVKKHLFKDIHDNPVWYNLDTIKKEFNRKNSKYFRQHFFRYFIMRLDGKSRFQLIESKHYHIWRTSRTPFNYLSRLYNSAEEQRKLAEIVNEEFDWYTYLGKNKKDFINIYLSNAPKIEINELQQKNQLYSSEEIIPIGEFGDGVQCFVGICLSVLSCPFRIILIDEPEAYLHPPTAYSLGKNLSQWAEEKNRSIIISTHSSDFLMGCLQSLPDSDISIIRLTYQDKISRVRKLEDSEVQYFAKDPLLRSGDVLNALFHNSAVVGEGGKDKLAYQEANNRLVRYKRGIRDAVFLNANGKDVVPRIVRPLRKIGVPTAAIYDFDVIKKQQIRGIHKTLWKLILTSSNVENNRLQYFENERHHIESAIQTLNRSRGNMEQDYFENLPTDKIPGGLNKRIFKFLDELKEYGIFIVPVGRLEQWLKDVPYKRPDSDFVKLISKINSTELTPNDIWKFIEDVNSWLTKSDRKGMSLYS